MLRSKKFSLKNKKSQQKRSFYISNRVKLMIFISFVVGKIEWARRNQLNLFLWLLNFFLRLKLGWFSGDVHMQRNIVFFFAFLVIIFIYFSHLHVLHLIQHYYWIYFILLLLFLLLQISYIIIITIIYYLFSLNYF